MEVFKRRMSIKELFRDEKNIRYGWGLRQLKIGTAGRLERLLLVSGVRVPHASRDRARLP